MADYNKLIPFVLMGEGGYVNDPTDAGGETNKGITWKVWVSYFGDTPASHHRFLAMEPGDWGAIFKGEYWDKVLADKINSQRIADTIVDWVFNSGRYFPELDTQKLINSIFHKNLSADGVFGPATIEILNECDEPILYQSLIARRKQFYQDIVDSEKAKIVGTEGQATYDTLTAQGKTQAKFLKGWLNRIDDLVLFNSKL